MADYIIDDRRTEQEKENTLGFVVATDLGMSGWGQAPNLSYVACAFVDHVDEQKVKRCMESQNSLKRVRVVYGKMYKPRLTEGDHLSIRGFSDYRFDY